MVAISAFNLHSSHGISLTSSVPPSKSRSSSIMVLNLRTPSLILRLPFTTSFLSSAISVKPIFSKPFKWPLRVTMQQKYVYPDPIPEFSKFETQKFRGELLKQLSKNKESFGDDLDGVVNVCSEIFSNFLYKEYGGPGTLLVEPFTDMLVALKEKKLPGAPMAARAALLWAQNYLDKDWELWNKKPPK